ncbi:type IV toxin-antitoxin system AbiEi family antitoxin domain-containing protein [Arthrobacter castelli]|uniref:type IV toxin-antitoxin system AbiEi family antitoxin domain-containing protein n=1 Tax=Arthrobacter castelli TaxID=271431 RepID=UPI0004006E14|nr:type IV toxin-antitoxin system AbiEi family antitoxin domain-containing protein [Arthrobacter castelli]
MSSEVLTTISDLAAGQWGLLTTKQAAELGVSRVQLARLADAGVLERMQQGVYAMASSTDDSRDLRAAWLSLDPGFTAEQRIADDRGAIVASHTSAAHLHGMGDLLYDAPEFNTRRRKQTVRGIRLHRLQLSPEDVVLVDGLPTTSPERTIADLVRGRHDLTHVAYAIRDGHRSGVLDIGALGGQLEQVAGRTGHRDGTELLDQLLDLAGLSIAAVMKSTFGSPVGQLIAASAIRQYQDFIRKQLDMPRINSSLFRAARDAGVIGSTPPGASRAAADVAALLKDHIDLPTVQNTALQAAIRDISPRLDLAQILSDSKEITSAAHGKTSQ